MPRPIFVCSATTPPKGTFLQQTTRFEPSPLEIGLVAQALREPEKVGNKKENEKQSTQTVYSTCAWGLTPREWQDET
jgi:hypothetical protein